MTGGVPYITYNGYNAFAQPTSVTYGNGVSTIYQYYTTNNRLRSITTNSQPSGVLMNLSYAYDNAGNIINLTDPLTYPDNKSRSRKYKYDDLDRLTEADSVSYGGNIVYTYDKIGNMTYNCRFGHYTYDPYHTHAVKEIRRTDGTLAAQYVYDDNGNMVNSYSYDKSGIPEPDEDREFSYNFDNMPIRISRNGNTDSTYDANGQRVKKVTPSSTTIYVGQTYECTNGVCTKYIVSGTQIIAQISAAGTYYYHTDHLGSSSIITNSSGSQVEDIYYYPYGEIRTNDGSVNVRYKFTGKEYDSDEGLYYYGARYYDPKLARFISADTIVPLPFYPISLNRYAYTNNNPLIYKDPTGHWGDSVHYDDTYNIFRNAGFPHWIAHEVASFNLQVDYGSKNPNPWGDQSWHFNADRNASYSSEFDTRNIHYQEQYDKTYEAIGRGDAVTALQEFGAGLHPVQDLYAHSPEYVHDAGFAYYHWPSWLGGGADVTSINSIAYQSTITWTIDRAQSFYDMMSSRGMITTYDPRTVAVGSNGGGSGVNYNYGCSYCTYYSSGYNSGYGSGYDYSSYGGSGDNSSGSDWWDWE